MDSKKRTFNIKLANHTSASWCRRTAPGTRRVSCEPMDMSALTLLLISCTLPGTQPPSIAFLPVWIQSLASPPPSEVISAPAWAHCMFLLRCFMCHVRTMALSPLSMGRWRTVREGDSEWSSQGWQEYGNPPSLPEKTGTGPTNMSFVQVGHNLLSQRLCTEILAHTWWQAHRQAGEGLGVLGSAAQRIIVGKDASQRSCISVPRCGSIGCTWLFLPLIPFDFFTVAKI